MRARGPALGALPAPGRSRGRSVAGRNDSGTALLVALLALLALTALATGGLILSRLEREGAGVARAAVKARYLADAGLADFLAGELPGGDTLGFRYPGGGARVWAEGLVRLDEHRRLYRLVSRGVAETPRGRPVEREVSTVALEWSQTLASLPEAAFVTLDGLRVDGGSIVSGDDACTGETAVGLYAAAGVPVEGDRAALRGRPPLAEGGTARSELSAARLAWRGLESGELLSADAGIAGGRRDAEPDERAAGYAVVRLDGPSALLGPAGAGAGVIIAAGDLLLEEGFRWDGVILAGGAVRAQGAVSVGGVVASGLDLGIGEGPVGPGATGSGSRFIYDSCAVGRASRALSRATRRLVERPGGRAESI